MIAKNLIFGNKVLDALYIPAVVVLVGLTAFGLGRLSALQSQKGELRVYGPSATVAPAVLGASTATPMPQEKAAGATEGVYVASKNGTRYYLPSCSGAKRIKEENKIWFGSVEAAQGAGFTPAVNCPGL